MGLGTLVSNKGSRTGIPPYFNHWIGPIGLYCSNSNRITNVVRYNVCTAVSSATTADSKAVVVPTCRHIATSVDHNDPD